MNLQKRDRGSVRTAKDIEMKYNFGKILKTGKRLENESERIDKLIKIVEDLSNGYGLLSRDVEQNIKNIETLKSTKIDKNVIEQNYYSKEEMDEIINNITTQMLTITRKTMYYTTVKEIENTIKMPSYYKEDCLVDIFINGLKLEKSNYDISLKDEEYFLNLYDDLDVIGTLVEIDIIEGMKEE